MDYGKLDAPLAAALGGWPGAGAAADRPEFTVFVQLADDVAPADREALAALGLAAPEGEEGRSCRATLTRAQVEALSDHPGVRRMHLSAHLRLRPDM